MDREQAFREFFDAEFVGLRRLAYLLTGDWGEAEDLAQETMVRMYRSWNSIKERPAAYARSVLINRHRSLLRRAKVEAKHALVRKSFGPPPSAELEDEYLVVWEALRTLPQRERQAVVLRYYEDMPVAEIAEVLGCPVGTVKSMTHRALGRLREQLGPQIALPAIEES